MDSDLNSALHQAACPMSRPHFDVATSRQQGTCRDIKAMSRHHSGVPRSRPHRFSCQAPSQVAPYVATSISCRDILDGQPMSRHQSDVATPLRRPQVATSPFLLPSPKPGRTLCRDIDFMSRHPRRPTYVATSSSCRDINSLQARSRHQFHVATS